MALNRCQLPPPATTSEGGFWFKVLEWSSKLCSNFSKGLAVLSTETENPKLYLATFGTEFVCSIMKTVLNADKNSGPDPILLDCMNRNFEMIQKNSQAIAQNAQMIERNYKTILQVSQQLQDAKTEILKGIEKSTVLPILSDLKTFLNDFNIKNKELMLLSDDERLIRLENPDNFMQFFKELMVAGKSGNFHARLNDIINLNLATPNSEEDGLKFVMLYILMNGLLSYVSMLNTLYAQYGFLIEQHFDKSEMKEYNKFMKIRSGMFKDIGSRLIATETGLIERVIHILEKTASAPLLVKNENLITVLIETKNDFKGLKTEIANNIKSQFIELPTMINIMPNFSKSKIRTPAKPNWIAKRKVSYAVLLQDEDTKKQTILSKWSNPYRIGSKACPIVTIPLDSQCRTRVIYRKFDSEEPQMVAIITVHNATSFVDIDREVFNIAKETSEDAIEETELYLQNGANINAAFEKGRTALHMAAVSGHLDLVRYLIYHRARTDQFDRNGYTALHNAAWKGAVDFVRGAIEEGLINANVLSFQSNTPLHSAVLGKQTKVVKVLLSLSATDILIKNKDGLSALHVAVMRGYETIVELFLSSERMNNTIINQHTDGDLALLHSGKTALHLAIEKKDIVLVRLLLKWGADVTAQTSKRQTSLHYAVMHYEPALLGVLLKAPGAPVNQPDIFNMTPLYYALQHELADVVTVLVAHCAKVNLLLVDGRNQLHLAAEKGDAHVVQGLIKLGADVNQEFYVYSEGKKMSKQAFDLALENGHLKVIEVLIKNMSKNLFFSFLFKLKSNLNLNENQSFQLIKIVNKEQLALFACQKGFIRLLNSLKNNFDYVRMKMECVENAIKFSQVEVIKIVMENSQLNLLPYLKRVVSESGSLELFQQIADKYPSKWMNIVDDWDSQGNSMLHLAARYNRYNILKYIIDSFREKYEDKYKTYSNKDFLVKQSMAAHLDALNVSKESLLYLACFHHADTQMIAYLLNAGAKIGTSKNFNGLNAELYFAAHNGNFPSVKLLVANGAKVEQVYNVFEYSPLAAAISGKGSLELVKYFEEKGVNLNSTGKIELNGEIIKITLVYLALIEGKNDIVEYLIQKGVQVFTYKSVKTPEWLQEVAFFGSLFLVQMALKEEKSVENLKIKDNDGLDALHYTLSHLTFLGPSVNNAASKLEIIKLLLSSGGDINSVDLEGISLLHRAIESGFTEIAVYLIEKGANYNTTSTELTTPLSTAVAKDYIGVAKMLLKKGCLVGNVFEAKSLDMLQLLLSYGANPLERNAKGVTLFEIAIQRQRSIFSNATNWDDILRWYLFTFKTASGRTVAHEVQTPVTLQYIASHGGNLNAPDHRGNTPLHAAAAREDDDFSEIVKIWLEQSHQCVSFEARNAENETAADVAWRMEEIEVALELQDKEISVGKRVKRKVVTNGEISEVKDRKSLWLDKLLSKNSVATSVVDYLTGGMAKLWLGVTGSSGSHYHPNFSFAKVNKLTVDVKVPFSLNNLNRILNNTSSEVNSTLLLLDVLARKCTGVRYFSSSSSSSYESPMRQLDIRAYALNVTEQFVRTVKQVGRQLYGVEQQQLQSSSLVDHFKLFKQVEALASAGRCSEIEFLLKEKLASIYPQLEEKKASNTFN